MRSEKQRAASRLNGAKSRGPVTANGKRNASQNATRHGAFAQAILLPTESGEAFDLLADAAFEEFAAATPFEATLVEDMVSARWRAKRFAIMEQALMTQELKRLERHAADTGEMSDLDAAGITGIAFRELADHSQALQLLHRYAVRFHREYLRCHRRLVEVQDRRRHDNPPPTQPGPKVVAMSAARDIENQEQTRQLSENTEEPGPNPAAIAFLGVFAERILATSAEPVGRPVLAAAAFSGRSDDSPAIFVKNHPLESSTGSINPDKQTIKDISCPPYHQHAQLIDPT